MEKVNKMSAHDSTEKILRQIHKLLSKSEPYHKEPSKVIVDKKEMLDLLNDLNRSIYDIYDEYELTQQSRDRAEREFRKKGDEIVWDASRKAEDVYAASVLYTEEALNRTWEMVHNTNESMQQLYEQMNNKVKEQEKLIKKNQLELKAALQDLVDTEKYLTIIEDRNREIQKQKEAGREKKEILREKNIYANRQTEIKVNTEYLEKMGYSIDEGTEEPAEQTTVDEKPAKQEIEIHINPDYQKKAEEYKQDPDLSAQLDAEYFKAQAEKEARASKETKEITEGIHKMWRSLVNKD